MPAPANLVHQTTTGTGTGNLTLVAVNGKQSFNSAFGNGVTTNVFDYYISHQSAAEWERGTGHMSDATTLVRDTVIESTNANAAVSFSAGTKDVVNDIPALTQVRGVTFTDNAIVRGDTSVSGALVQNSGVTIDDTNNVNIPGTLTVTGATTLGGALTVSGLATLNGGATINGTLNVSGATNLGALNVSGNTAMVGTLTVSGQANFNAAQPSAVFADAAARLSAMRVYTTTGNVWSKPAGLTFVIVEVCGAGGGSSGANIGKTIGGGGGAGGYAIRKIAAASLGATENVVVGTGGSAGASGGTAGGAGGSSSFGTTSFMTGCGGGGGPTGNSGNSLGGSGGLSTSGDMNCQGGDGGPGLWCQVSSGATLSSNGLAGWGGTSRFGGGPAGASVGVSGNSQPGFAGHSFGSGAAGSVGSSAGSGASGAVGAKGVVIVWEYI